MEKREAKKTVRAFALASFLNDFGSDMIYPIWPLFVTSFFGANMFVLGLIDGLGDAIVSISQAISGYISDKVRRRKVFIWTGYLCGSFSRIGYAFSSVWQHLIPFRILDRAGKMRGAPRDAIVADISTQEERGRTFGLLRTMDNLGATFGIITCLLLFEKLGYRNLFLLAALPSLVSVFVVLLFVREEKVSRTRVFKGITLKELSKDFKSFLVLSSFFALGAFSYSFLLIYAKQFGFKASFVPVLYLIFTVVASISSLPFGRLSDAIGRRPVMALSLLLWVAVCLNFIFFHRYWMLILAFILYGLHKGAIEPVQKTFVAELAPAEYRASCLGGFQLVIGLFSLPSSLIAGLIWDRVDMLAPLYLSLGLTLLSVIILMFVKETR